MNPIFSPALGSRHISSEHAQLTPRFVRGLWGCWALSQWDCISSLFSLVCQTWILSAPLRPIRIFISCFTLYLKIKCILRASNLKYHNVKWDSLEIYLIFHAGDISKSNSVIFKQISILSQKLVSVERCKLDPVKSRELRWV